ncbi:Uncharacterised protein [Parabacteroides distasonis]|nr:Uncharacterised protein [Parabacteroides distasonis]
MLCGSVYCLALKSKVLWLVYFVFIDFLPKYRENLILFILKINAF